MEAAGFVASVIGTAALVSSAVKTFAGLCNAISEKSEQDVDLRVKALLFELQSTDRKIADWRQAWIPEKVDSDTYFMLLWGNTGRKEIDNSLERIRLRANTIIDRSSLLTKSLDDSFANDNLSSSVSWLEWRRSTGANQQSLNASAREDIRSNVGELVMRVLELRDSTDLHFRSMHVLGTDNDQKPARLDEVLESRSVSIAAYEICGKQANAVDLELNLLDNEGDIDKLADVFDWCDLPCVYRLSMEDKADPSLMRNVALEISNSQGSTADTCLVHNDAAKKAYSQTPWQCPFCENAVNSKEDIVRHQSFISKRRNQANERLLPYLILPSSKGGKRAKKSLTQMQKKGFGFRIAECALFLMGTPWLAGISHATIYDLGTFQKTDQFFIRVPLNQVDGIASPGDLSEERQIRKIGVLLVETALETVWTTETELAAPTEEMMQRVRDQMGLSYQEACQYCFSLSSETSKQLSPVPSAEYFLTAFYLHVYLRLRDSYNDLRANSSSQQLRKKKGFADWIRW